MNSVGACIAFELGGIFILSYLLWQRTLAFQLGSDHLMLPDMYQLQYKLKSKFWSFVVIFQNNSLVYDELICLCNYQWLYDTCLTLIKWNELPPIINEFCLSLIFLFVQKFWLARRIIPDKKPSSALIFIPSVTW